MLTIGMLLFSIPVNAQKLTRVKGTVRDSLTNEVLPFVTVAFKGKSIGTVTDYDGKYLLESQWASDTVEVSFLGYKTQVKPIINKKTQTVDFYLNSTSIELGVVDIVAKKTRYRNKNNPSVELIRKAIDNKKNNRLESQSFYEYDKYEKVEFDLNNVTESFKKKKIFKKFQFIFDYEQVSKINGKPYLPVYLKETLSKIYYRKSPDTKREYVSGVHTVGFEDYVDEQGLALMVDNLYQDVDLYENNISLLTNQFVSPISDIGPLTYKYFILDTLDVSGTNCIQVGFQPRNKQNFAFVGDLYITNDETYAVKKVSMRITDEINLNFVQDLMIEQEFELAQDSAWILVKDEMIIDFNLTKKGMGVFGRKNVTYDNYLFDVERKDSIYSGLEKIIYEEDFDNQDDTFWIENRLDSLTEVEKDVYVMMDTLQSIPAFKRTMDIVVLLISGYWHFGPIDVGAVNTFYSFNEIEGFRLRLGGRTSTDFSEKLMIEGYGLYGFKDEQFKYALGATYSLSDRAWNDNPKHTIRAMYQKETVFPGMELQFLNEDNFLLSFKRGVDDKIYYYKNLEFEYFNDRGNGISYSALFKNVEKSPGGNMTFSFEDGEVPNITTTELGGSIRFAPNEKFYQGMVYKIPIINKYPILKLSYVHSFDGLFNSDYTYDKVTLNLFKRFYMSPIGFMDVEFEASKLFGDNLPFPLLNVLRANQTYAYQLYSYNLMNFLEFVTDQHISLNVEHSFNGFIMNKIPLIRRLKLRSLVTFKGVYGSLRDVNNPEKNHEAMLFPTDLEGNKTTFTLEEKPYIEVSVGVGNILKFFRVDIVKRLTYLDNPNVPEYGLRGRFKFDF